MAAGNVGYTDTRAFSGSLLGDMASGIKDRIGNSMQMARAERANAAKALNVGGRNDGVTQEEFDKEYGKGYFFKRALGSNFGGDRIARTRGYFESDPPARRDPTGTRESRFSAGFDYASKEGLIKSARPLQGPKAPEYLYAYDRRYADVLGDAAKFKDDTLDKDKMMAKSPMFGGTTGTTDTRSFGGKKDKNAIPVEDKQLNEKIASSLAGVEVQMTRLEQKMNSGEGEDGEVASLVSQNSKAIVAGFTGIHAALSSFLGMTEKQTKAIKDGAEAKNDAEEKSEDKANRAAEELGAEGADGGVGNAAAQKLGKASEGGGFWGGLLGGMFDLFTGRGLVRGKGTNPRALRRLMRMKGGGMMRGMGRGLIGPAAGAMMMFGALDGGMTAPTARYDQVTGPNSFYNDPRRRPRFRDGASIPGGSGKSVIVGDTAPGVSEAIIPMSPDVFRQSAKAQLQVMKKNRDFFNNVYADGNKKFFNGPNGWAELGKKLWDSIKGIFGGGQDDPPRDPPPPGSLEPISLEGFSESEISDLGRIVAAEAGDEQGRALVLNSILNRYRQIKSGKVAPSAWGIEGKTKDEVTISDVIRAKNQYQPMRDGSFDKVTADQGTEALSQAISGGGLDPEQVKNNLVQSGKSEADATMVAVADSFYNPNLSDNKPFKDAPVVKTDNDHAFMSSPIGYKPADLSNLNAVTQNAPEPAPDPDLPGQVTPQQMKNLDLMESIVPGFKGSFLELSDYNESTSEKMAAPLSAFTLPSAAPQFSAGSSQESSNLTGMSFSEFGGFSFTPSHPSGQ